jgi:hypothetical protein
MVPKERFPKNSDNGQNYWGSGVCSASGIKNLENNFRKMDLFPSSNEGRKTLAVLITLERPNLNYCTTRVL